MSKANLTALGKALLKAGLVSEKDIPEEQLEKLRSKEQEPGKLPSVPWEKPACCKITENKPKHPKLEGGKTDSDDKPDVSRRRGYMVWLHKTAPVFQFEDDPTLTPEDYRSGRRR